MLIIPHNRVPVLHLVLLRIPAIWLLIAAEQLVYQQAVMRLVVRKFTLLMAPVVPVLRVPQVWEAVVLGVPVLAELEPPTPLHRVAIAVVDGLVLRTGQGGGGKDEKVERLVEARLTGSHDRYTALRQMVVEKGVKREMGDRNCLLNIRFAVREGWNAMKAMGEGIGDG